MDTILRLVEEASVTIFAILALFMVLAMALKTVIYEYRGLRKVIGYLGNVETEKPARASKKQ